MKINKSKLLQWPPFAVSIVTLYELFVKYTGLKLPNLTAQFSHFFDENNFLMILIILISTTALLASCYFLVKKFIKRPKYYKYCPECDFGINAKNPENYCQCGTKYLEKCPECNKKIIRDRSRICCFCGYNFPTKPKTGLEWMAR
ncbi:MAG: hypothetical protein Q8K51_07345 [Nitrospirota bacterium]|nr:hypothetical protein [Nitrospirota bacterium]